MAGTVPLTEGRFFRFPPTLSQIECHRAANGASQAVIIVELVENPSGRGEDLAAKTAVWQMMPPRCLPGWQWAQEPRRAQIPPPRRSLTSLTRMSRSSSLAPSAM